MKSLIGPVRRPDVIFRNDGHFDLTARVVRALDIHPGDVIDVLYDGCEYYLYVLARAADICGRYETACFPSRRGAHHFRGSSKRLCRAILDACGAPTRAALPCGDPVFDDGGRRLLPIIIRVNLSK